MTFTHLGDLWPWGWAGLAVAGITGTLIANGIHHRLHERMLYAGMLGGLGVWLKTIFFPGPSVLEQHIGAFSTRSYSLLSLLVTVVSYFACVFFLRRRSRMRVYAFSQELRSKRQSL